MPKLTSWVRKVHIYAGLQALLAALVFGFAGLGATWEHAPGHTEPRWEQRAFDLELPPDATDRALADRAHATLAVPLTKPPGDWAIARDDDGMIRYRLGSPQGITEVVLNPETHSGTARSRALSFAELCIALHMVKLNVLGSDADFRLKLWALYIELSVWSLWLFVVSGLYLWLAVRPLRPLALWAMGSGALFVVVAAIWVGLT